MVYPQEDVTQLIAEKYVPVKIPVASDQETVNQWDVQWTPTLIWLDGEGRTLHRSVGYLPKEDLLDHFAYAEAQHLFRKGEFGPARDRFQRIAKEHASGAAAPAAIYWAGVADYKASATPDGLKEIWGSLREKYPDSEWTRKASFVWA